MQPSWPRADAQTRLMVRILQTVHKNAFWWHVCCETKGPPKIPPHFSFLNFLTLVFSSAPTDPDVELRLPGSKGPKVGVWLTRSTLPGALCPRKAGAPSQGRHTLGSDSVARTPGAGGNAGPVPLAGF